MSAVESTGALYSCGGWGVSLVCHLLHFWVFSVCSFWLSLRHFSIGRPEVCFPGAAPFIFLSAYCSWLVIWSSHCFCRLVSTCLSILLSRTHSIPIFIPATVKSISLVFPLWRPLHKGCIVYFVNCFACNSIICILCQPQLLPYFPYTIYVSLTEMH